uniref:B-cell receptor CD22 n=1 Tax=Anolis carolinensis TaxID=28377 RepID=H9GSA7_ANOCA
MRHQLRDFFIFRLIASRFPEFWHIKVWLLHGHTMWCFLWMFFFEGVLCFENAIVISPNLLTAWKGSCVLIPCEITSKLRNISLIWWYNPFWHPSLKDYYGIMLYNASTASINHTSPVSTHFQDRVRFTGDLHNRNCSLKISQLQKSDTGMFGARLQGFDQYKHFKKWFLSTDITISDSPPKPKITFSPQEIQEKEKTYVTCSVSYHCPDEPVMVILTGLEEGRMIPQKAIERKRVAQTYLSFMPTWKDHRKQLTCLLKSHNGTEISRDAVELDVKYAPRGVQLTATPGITVTEGMKLSLKCLVNSSNPAASYQWKKNSGIIYYTEDQIEFDSVQEKHSGRYKCTAKNQFGTVDSNELTIDVQYPPKETKVQCPSCGNIREKNPVVLQCSSKGNPSIRRYEWFKHSEQSKISMQKELRFKAVQPSDSNTYFCKAYNGIGNSTSLPFTLDVQYGPKDVQIDILNLFPIKEEDIITFNCSVGSSNPKTNTYKLLNSRDVPVKSTTESNLITFPAKPGPITSYKCEACNDIACTQSPEITVDVHFAPKEVRAVRQPSGLIDEGAIVKLSCEVGRANPEELTYIWYKDTDQVLSETPILTIQKVTSRASGNYHCKAKNSVGIVSSSAVLLDVRYGPKDIHVSLNLQEAVIEGKDALLQCKNTANPSANVYKWYWNGEEMAQKNTPVLELRKVQVGQSGDYSCKVSNQVAEGQSQPMALIVYYSRATVLKRSLIGLGTVLALLALLGLLAYVLWRRKKNIDSDTGGTQRSGSFFVKKTKGERLCNNNNRENEVRADGSVGFLNQGSEGSVTYATVQFRSNLSEDRVVYSSINQPKPAVDPSDTSDIYSVVKKPGNTTTGDTKHDYENVDKMEEELHYSSLVNLAPRPGPTYGDSETESESEDSIQYASLKH